MRVPAPEEKEEKERSRQRETGGEAEEREDSPLLVDDHHAIVSVRKLKPIAVLKGSELIRG
jgi:hypothetical protein